MTARVAIHGTIQIVFWRCVIMTSDERDFLLVPFDAVATASQAGFARRGGQSRAGPEIPMLLDSSTVFCVRSLLDSWLCAGAIFGEGCRAASGEME